MYVSHRRKIYIYFSLSLPKKKKKKKGRKKEKPKKKATFSLKKKIWFPPLNFLSGRKQPLNRKKLPPPPSLVPPLPACPPFPISINRNHHILRPHPNTLLILHPRQLLLQRRPRLPPRHTPGSHIRLKAGLELEERPHDKRRFFIAVHPHQPLAAVRRDQVARVAQQLPAVRRAQPGGVGFREGVLLAGQRGPAVGEAPVVEGPEGCGRETHLHARVVEGAAEGDGAVWGEGGGGAAGGHVELEARAEDAVGDGGEGAVEVGGGVEGGGGAGGDF